jgi:hypothetical protein
MCRDKLSEETYPSRIINQPLLESKSSISFYLKTNSSNRHTSYNCFHEDNSEHTTRKWAPFWLLGWTLISLFPPYSFRSVFYRLWNVPFFVSQLLFLIRFDNSLLFFSPFLEFVYERRSSICSGRKRLDWFGWTPRHLPAPVPWRMGHAPSSVLPRRTACPGRARFDAHHISGNPWNVLSFPTHFLSSNVLNCITFIILFSFSRYLNFRYVYYLHYEWNGYGKGNRIPSGICWGFSEFLLHPIDGAIVRETPPLLTAGLETHPRRRGNSLPVSRSACVVSSYASTFRTNLMYQPHSLGWRTFLDHRLQIRVKVEKGQSWDSRRGQYFQ